MPTSAGAALRPVGREQAEPVEHERAERVVVLREVVDRRRARPARAGTSQTGAQSKSRRALDLERELDRREQRVEAGRRLARCRRPRRGAACRSRSRRASRCGRAARSPDRRAPASSSRRRARQRVGVRRRDGADALAARDLDVRSGVSPAGGLEQADEAACAGAASSGGASESETSTYSIPLRTPASLTARRRRSSQHDVPHGDAPRERRRRRAAASGARRTRR